MIIIVSIYWTWFFVRAITTHAVFAREELRQMASEAKFLMAQFLTWIEAKPRSLGEVRAAWSSTCPLNCAWEDALSDDLVECRANGIVTLSAQGRARLEYA
jgi:hypothetical protein